MAETKSLQILIVEDDFLVSEWIRRMLQQAGYKIAGVAMNGLKAIEQAQALRPDVILMDIGLPGEIDGIEAARRITEIYPTPVVILTAYESPEMLARASAAGVGAYLIKPTNERAVERAITIAQARFKDLMALRQLNADLQAEIIRRQQAEEAKTSLTQELMSLYETSLEINTQPDLPALLNLIAKRSAQLLKAQLCAIYLTQPDGHQVLQVLTGAGDSHPAINPEISILTNLAEHTALSGQALLPDGFQHEGHYFARVMSLPLQAGRDVIGVLLLADSQNPEPFNQHEFWLGDLFAEQATIAIENTQLRQAVRREPPAG